MTRAEKLEALAKEEWAEMTDAEKLEYDNDFNFFVSDILFAMLD